MDYYHNLWHKKKMTPEQLERVVKSIKAFLTTMMPNYALIDYVVTSSEEVNKQFSALSAVLGVWCPEGPSPLWKLRRYIDCRCRIGGNESNVIFVDHDKEAGKVSFYIGHPSGLDRNGLDYPYPHKITIDINKKGEDRVTWDAWTTYDAFKTDRDPRCDNIYAIVFGILAAMYPECYEYSNDDDYSDVLKTIAEQIPSYVGVEEVKVGGKTKKKSKKTRDPTLSRRSERLRLM